VAGDILGPDPSEVLVDAAVVVVLQLLVSLLRQRDVWKRVGAFPSRRWLRPATRSPTLYSTSNTA